MKTGKVRWFCDSKGYGFIDGEDGVEVFVHYSSILMEGYRSLRADQIVCYEAVETPKGWQALNVTISK